jgi:DNA repair protein RecO (recombination protein O)
MNQFVTRAVVLARTDYGEADRILTLLTPDYGKLRLMAKGVRRVKSKLAGGIELFSVTNITFIRGRSEIGTLISSRLVRHYGHIITDIDRTMLGYELIKLLNKVTEDEPEADYFHLLEQMFAALDDTSIDTALIRLWFSARLLRLGGFTPNLQTDSAGQKLQPTARYIFDFESTGFRENTQGTFGANEIKFLRLLFGGNEPKVLSVVQGGTELSAKAVPLVQSMLSAHLKIGS